MSAVSAPVQHEPATHRPPSGPKRSVWIRPGWWRALLWTWTAGGLGIALPAIIRWLLGWDWYSRPVTFTTVLFLMPIGFILGIGCFDYWGRYIIGSPTRPEDHADHGAYRWQDYFKVNTDHKVIGIQYLVTTFAFFLIGGLCAEAFRTELAKTGPAVHDRRSVQRPDVRARRADDLPVRDSRVRRARELRDPADARRGRHGVPAAERAQLLDAPDRRRDDGREPLLAGLRRRLDGVCAARLRLPDRLPALLQHRRAVRGHLVDPDGRQLHRHDPDDARSGYDALADAAPGLGQPDDLGTRRAGHAVRRRVAVHAAVRPRDAHRLLQLPGRRCRAAVPARLLVLLTPGRVHHDAARVRDRLRGHLGDGAQADLRLPRRRVLDDLHRRARLHGVGAPHVRRRDAAVAAHPDHGLDASDRGADRHQGVLVGRHALERRDRPEYADAVRDRLPVHVRARRPLRRLAGARSRSTSTSPARTSSSRTSTTCCSAGRCSRSTPGCTSGTRR